MAKSVKVRSKFTIPGSGYNSSGTAKNNKTIVIGEIAITSYTASGEPLTAADLGLETIDFLGLDVRSVNDAVTEPASGAIPMAAYDGVLQLLIVNIDHGADTAVSTGEAANVRFLALGDSAVVADLT